MKNAKKIIYGIWLGLVILLFLCFIVSPDLFSADKLADKLENYKDQLLLVYIVVSFLRGLFLIPSTPFVLAGVLLFPFQPWAVFSISIIGVALGATAIYYFSDFLGFSKKLEAKYPEKLKRWHLRLNSPKATLFVIGWSFFPFVPTDIICYVAGIVKMPFRFLIAGVIIGEVVLIYLYVFYGSGVAAYLFG